MSIENLDEKIVRFACTGGGVSNEKQPLRRPLENARFAYTTGGVRIENLDAKNLRFAQPGGYVSNPPKSPRKKKIRSITTPCERED